MSKSSKSNSHFRKGMPPRPPAPVAQPRTSRLRWLVLALVLVGTAGSAWAFSEFVLWNRLPAELVGKWAVAQGPPEYEDARFEFQRSGKMIGIVNDNGNEGRIFADVRVEDNKIYATTRSQGGKEHVSVHTIQSVTANDLILVDDRGRAMKLVRIK